MEYNKKIITAYSNGKQLGYIKSVSYKYGSFKLTQNKLDAKGYKTDYEAQSEIDFLARISFGTNYIFIYD